MRERDGDFSDGDDGSDVDVMEDHTLHTTKSTQRRQETRDRRGYKQAKTHYYMRGSSSPSTSEDKEGTSEWQCWGPRSFDFFLLLSSVPKIYLLILTTCGFLHS